MMAASTLTSEPGGHAISSSWESSLGDFFPARRSRNVRMNGVGGQKVALWTLAVIVSTAACAHSQAQSARPIKISVDATQASRRVLHSQLEIPASPGPLTLYYPKWLPADHSPDGPISNVAGLKFSAAGKRIPWRQDPVDMYAFHVIV